MDADAKTDDTENDAQHDPEQLQDTDQTESRRAKVRERQRRKRARDKGILLDDHLLLSSTATTTAANTGGTLVTTPTKAVQNSLNELTMSPKQLEKYEEKKRRARERQRKHRDLVRHRKSVERLASGVPAQDHPLTPTSSSAQSPHTIYPGFSTQYYPFPNPLAAPPHSSTGPANGQGHHFVASQGAHPTAAPTHALPYNSTTTRTPGDFFATTLLAAVNQTPGLRDSLLSSLQINQHELSSFHPVISGYYNHWDHQRRTQTPARRNPHSPNVQPQPQYHHAYPQYLPSADATQGYYPEPPYEPTADSTTGSQRERPPASNSDSPDSQQGQNQKPIPANGKETGDQIATSAHIQIPNPSHNPPHV